jgi:uncharacterized OB-fold protein
MSDTAAQIISRPLPVPDADSAPFWEACKEHRLTVQECSACGQRRFPPIGVCHRCRSWEFTWVEVTEGTVYSWIVATMSPIESLRADLPYVVAVVHICDGVRIPTQLVGVAPDDVRADMPVVVHWQEVAGGMSLPYFKPAEA